MPPQIILAGVVGSQLADTVTFAVAVRGFGISVEANALAVTLYQLGGLEAVLVAKGLIILAALAILVFAAHRFPRTLFMGGAVATSLGLLGFLTNIISLTILS